MHANQLSDLAAWIAVHSSIFVYGQSENTALDAKEYWARSKCRIAGWNSALRMFDNDLRHPENGHDPWPAFEIVAHEIIISEMLTRIMSAAFVIYDQYTNSNELKGIAHSLFVSHLETRNRAMRVLLAARAANEEAFDRCNRLRRQVERWTDLFLSRLEHSEKATGFAFDEKRLADFASERNVYNEEEFRKNQQLLKTSMRNNLESLTGKYAANPTLNAQIAAGALGCFANDRFDSYGLPKSSQMLWLEKSHYDAQVLVDELSEFEGTASKKS